MDQGIIGSIFTVIVFIAFIGVVYWAFSKRNKDRFEEAANLVFDDEEPKQNRDNQESNK
ncbi:cbb3-type cytochrome c oxidase subunit 3 [Alteromonas sp. LMIT006]|jgi:cytochrome c oxidase cbb3-type subunit 4|uniref:cbb3-type cytochrome oxidase subunit 3 n=1 Tax=Alteromonadaceae TaxID=72275 RepID=UPI0019E1FB92|nr:cbb3-type cytochrome c oxidase subunit 3 [Alteromonas sp. LMIT006]MBE1288288.1 CcoQ/FixQ family Cbb3-type cytochrome c oxidase assembly chaperone [Alteromonadaceae bacterium]UTP72074.1 cbb3-type cytochrome c oxidase subunit 3 [Alteromonas sp. LMIT006]